MAAPTTLLQFRTDDCERAMSDKAATATALSVAQAALRDAKESAVARGAEMSALDLEERAKRDALRDSTIQAEAEALVTRLRDISIERRATGYAVLRASATIANAQKTVARAQAAASTAASAADPAKAAFDAATDDVDATREASRVCLLDRLGRPPVSKVQTRAKANDVKTAVTDAKTRIAADIPAALLTRALSRGASASQRQKDAAKQLADAQTALRAFTTSTTGPMGTAAEKQAAYDAILATITDYVANAGARLDQAVARLAAIAAAPALSAEAEAAITALNESASADLEKARDDAQDALAAAEAALGAATLAAIRTDPDAVATDATVQAKTADRDAAAAALVAAEGAYTPADRTKLDDWEATVPDASWQMLAAFTEATAAIDALKALDPATLEPALSAAEADLAGALDALGKANRSAAMLAARVATARAESDTAAASASAELFSALRGDR
jgi:hypothetical protein